MILIGRCDCPLLNTVMFTTYITSIIIISLSFPIHVQLLPAGAGNMPLPHGHPRGLALQHSHVLATQATNHARHHAIGQCTICQAGYHATNV
jgi:hypothetical protein